MNVFYLPIGCTVLASTTWFITRAKLPPSNEELLGKLRPDAIEELVDFLPYKPVKGLVESEKDFWRLSGRYRGLWDRASNAVVYIRLAQKLEQQGMPREAVRCIFIKALWQWIYSVRALLKELIRFRGSPHFDAWIATHFYWELANLAEALNAQFGSESWMHV